MQGNFGKLIPILLLILFAACEAKEFSVNTENPKEITIVYGLLQPEETTHYLKIYKGFLTEGSVFDAAKDIHNYSYIDSIDVYLNEYKGKQLLRSILFDTTTCVPKDSGSFTYPLQILYTAQAKLDKDLHYEIVIRNRYSGKVVKAETEIVGDVLVTKPMRYSKELNIGYNTQNIRFREAANTYYYEASLTYYYTELLEDHSTRQGKPVLWKLGNCAFEPTAFYKELNISYQGEVFYRKIAEAIADDPSVVSRHTDSIVLCIHTAGKDLYKYMLASSASTGLNQERLTYSNIRSYENEEAAAENKTDGNALGIFSTKGTNTVMFRDFGIVSRDSLLHGKHTKHLKFTDIY